MKRCEVKYPTREQLLAVLDYDAETGAFTWRRRPDVDLRWNARFAGTTAGCDGGRGYLVVTFAGRQFLLHRLAWIIANGETPPGLIDHIDGDRSNNRIVNLRLATQSQNRANSALTWAASGFKGVYWKPRQRRWQPTIMIDGVVKYLGTHLTKEAAAAAYAAAAREHFGDFARIEG